MANSSFQSFLSDMILTTPQKINIYRAFECQIQKGLSKATNAEAEVKCYPTYVQELPTGKETGKFLALDLGGTNFRVICVQLAGKNPDKMESNIYTLSDAVITGTSDQLFDFIAKCLESFLLEHKIVDNRKKIPLGFTFSFPCTQISLNKALLVRWTKAFKVEGVVGKDVGMLMNKALKKLNLPVECVAIINDTVGTLMSCAHSNPNCRLGVIVGTGCNGCFVEPVKNVEMMDASYKNKPYVIINAEWGAFGDKGSLDFVRTPYDKEIDEKSRNVGTQIHEKMVSGLYMGDLVALMMAKAIDEQLLFTEHSDKPDLLERLHTTGFIKTSQVSDIEADAAPEYKSTKNILETELNITNYDVGDLEKIKEIVECVSRRSATLVGINIAYLIARSGVPNVSVAIDGGVYKNHPHYPDYLQKAIEDALPKTIQFDLYLSEDGSGRGAAIVASTAPPLDESTSSEPERTVQVADTDKQYPSCKCDED